MRNNRYFVSFGGFTLHRVESVSADNGREISEYDSVGSGKFNVPDNKNPQKWKIECELLENPTENTWRASEIFKAMDSLLNNTTDASRLVITNSDYPAANLSVLAWLKNYTKDEKYAGVYAVSIELEEYKPVGIKTTNIPYVARPGKVPAPPKVTIKKSGDVYKSFKKTGVGTKTDAKTKAKETGLYSNPFITRTDWKTGEKYLIEPKTGKPLTNPVTAKPGTYIVKSTGGTAISSSTGESTGRVDWSVPSNALKSTFGAIGTAISNWYNSHDQTWRSAK